MTISSSLNAGIAGLSANASRLASISDNIANSSTYGYKRVQTDFQSMVLSSSGGTYSAGGLRSSTTRLIDQSGPLVATNNPTDLAVSGRGMLPVASLSRVAASGGDLQMMLTTTGSFSADEQGYLTTDSGLVLLGWPATSDGTIPNFPRDTLTGLEPIQINNSLIAGEPTTLVSLGANLPSTDTMSTSDATTQDMQVGYFDNLGNAATLSFEFTPTVPASGDPASNEWTVIMRDSASNNDIVGEYTLTFDDSAASGGNLATVAVVSGGAYDPVSGAMIINVASGPIEISIGLIGENDGLTQYSDQFAPGTTTKDGYPAGFITGVEVDANGFVRAFFDTGFTRTIYQIPLVDLPNPNGMVSLDQQTYLPSPDSGPYFLWDAGDGPVGDVAAYAREESATDIAHELTAMIRTQRAYSSSAKVIQTVDEMLQETTNIKR